MALSEEQFVNELGFENCPFCGSDRVQDMEYCNSMDGIMLEMGKACNECKAQWIVKFVAIGYILDCNGDEEKEIDVM